MGFLDNSGDIILDAVLTDTGRFRLAKGDGSFRIVKFAFGDDEIDYSKYDKNHPSGTAYYDLDVLKTPVLEAFTNNTSTMKSKLISVNSTTLLYLPIIALNETFANSRTKRHGLGTFIVLVDEDTETLYKNVISTVDGIIKGENGTDGTIIRLDQGIDNEAISYSTAIDADLLETSYNIELDNRLGSIVDTGGTVQNPIQIDDDDFATYFFPDTSPLVGRLNNSKNLVGQVAISGPRGTFIEFRVKSSLRLNTSEQLFDELGSTAAASIIASGISGNIKFIDSTIKVEGVTTGYRVDVPVRFVKKI